MPIDYNNQSEKRRKVCVLRRRTISEQPCLWPSSGPTSGLYPPSPHTGVRVQFPCVLLSDFSPSFSSSIFSKFTFQKANERFFKWYEPVVEDDPA